MSLHTRRAAPRPRGTDGRNARAALVRGRPLLSGAFLAAILLAASVHVSAAQPVYHVLGKGETIFAVSRSYGVPSDAIMAANGIADPTKVKTGQRLLIPAVHKVEKGETIFGIAKSFGIGVPALRAANKLGSQSLIKPGDILYIPATPAPAAAPGPAVSEPAPDPAPGTSPGAAANPAPPGGSPVGFPAPGSPANGGGSPGAKAPAPGPAISSAVPTGGSSAPSASSGQNPSERPTQDTTASSQGVAGLGGGSSGTGGTPPMPQAVRVSPRPVDRKIVWPCPGDLTYLEGKLYGVMIRSKLGETERVVAGGTVVSAQPFRGYGLVAIVQTKTGHIYVYGGNSELRVKVGDKVRSGQEIGVVGMDAKDGAPVAYFFVYRNGEALDPATAPRD